MEGACSEALNDMILGIFRNHPPGIRKPLMFVSLKSSLLPPLLPILKQLQLLGPSLVSQLRVRQREQGERLQGCQRTREQRRLYSGGGVQGKKRRRMRRMVSTGKNRIR